MNWRLVASMVVIWTVWPLGVLLVALLTLSRVLSPCDDCGFFFGSPSGFGILLAVAILALVPPALITIAVRHRVSRRDSAEFATIFHSVE
jgi:hypothetical protein